MPTAPNGSLVLAFHGGGSTAAHLQRITGLDALADREHFIVAYPEAVERSWADGRMDTFAAIAPVIGAMAKNTAVSCRPRKAIAVVAIQGRKDPSVPFEGDDHLRSSPGDGNIWRSLNGCAPAVASMRLPVLVQDGTSVERRSYAGCRERGDVVWYEIEGGGHRWPPETVSDARSQAENGVSSQNLDASEVIWAFFKDHGRR